MTASGSSHACGFLCDLVLRSRHRRRLEGQPQGQCFAAILRDAVLRTAPQDEVMENGLNPHHTSNPAFAHTSREAGAVNAAMKARAVSRSGVPAETAAA